MTSQEKIKDLIAELEHIYMLIEDGQLDEAYDELECQSGTIDSIMREICSD